MRLISIRHDWPEKAGFVISRPEGIDQYTFLHFMTPINILIDGKVITTKAGACIFFSPETPQYFCCDQNILHNWAHFDTSLAQMLLQYDIPVNTLLYPKDTAFLSSLFGKMEAEYFSDGSYREQLLDSLANEFLIRFSRTVKGEQLSQPPAKTERRRLKEVRRHILSHPEEKWTVAKMAELMSLSPSRFHAVYKNLFGSSPMHDVIEAKILRAQSQLLNSHDLSIMQVAENLGYSDQYHFIRQFKALTGETPAAYRRKRG